VHALAQVAHFDLKKKIERKNLLPAINQNTAACDQVYKSVFAHLEVYTATLP
jgi:tRNA U38,U39,U40 pseudouridine synthase TruA